jgi:membrane protease YdiL (CAAX protease family)
VKKLSSAAFYSDFGRDRLGTIVALILSAAAFGLLHAGNPGATWVSTAAIALESGVLMGLAYSASRTL